MVAVSFNNTRCAGQAFKGWTRTAPKAGDDRTQFPVTVYDGLSGAVLFGLSADSMATGMYRYMR